MECSGYFFNYTKMEGGEIIFVTIQIPINSYQLYGFSRLDGDAKLPIHIDFMNMLSQKQLLTHLEREGFSLKLLNYGPNPYEFNLKPYQD